MAAPTFVNEYETVFNSSTSPKTTGSITTQVGDVLVCVGVTEVDNKTLNTPTNTGTGETWTLRQSIVVSNYCAVYAWTAVAATAQTMTVSVTQASGTSQHYGINVLHWRDSDGVGVSAKTNTTGAPSLSTGTLTSANSGLVVVNGDWSAADGTTRTPRTVNGSTGTERTYYRDSARYSAYIQTYADAGDTSAKTVGWSAPTGQQYGIIVVEVEGTASAAAYPYELLTPTPRYY